MNSARCFSLALLVCMAGCTATTFQNPPLAEGSCDSHMVGDWLSVADSASNDTPGEVELKIDTTCSLTMIEHKKDGDVVGDATAMHFGHDMAQDYFWLDALWAFKRAQSLEPAPAGDVYVLRYNILDKELQLFTIDDRTVAHRILDDQLKGEIHKTESTLVNRLTGTVTAEQLRSKIVFGDKPARFMRGNAGPAK